MRPVWCLPGPVLDGAISRRCYAPAVLRTPIHPQCHAFPRVLRVPYPQCHARRGYSFTHASTQPHTQPLIHSPWQQLTRRHSAAATHVANTRGHATTRRFVPRVTCHVPSATRHDTLWHSMATPQVHVRKAPLPRRLHHGGYIELRLTALPRWCNLVSPSHHATAGLCISCIRVPAPLLDWY